MIGSLDCDLAGAVARAHEEAVIAVARLEAGFGEHLAPLFDFLLRESVASSKNSISTRAGGVRQGAAGGKASAEAKSQLAAVKALLIAMVDAAGAGLITDVTVLGAYRLLMAPTSTPPRTSASSATCRTGSAATTPRSTRCSCPRHRNWLTS
ncbi:hypothetical protein R1X32_11880 [Rhodococcus opacus]